MTAGIDPVGITPRAFNTDPMIDLMIGTMTADIVMTAVTGTIGAEMIGDLGSSETIVAKSVCVAMCQEISRLPVATALFPTERSILVRYSMVSRSISTDREMFGTAMQYPEK